jgi:hypothetical protein
LTAGGFLRPSRAEATRFFILYELRSPETGSAIDVEVPPHWVTAYSAAGAGYIRFTFALWKD